MRQQLEPEPDPSLSLSSSLSQVRASTNDGISQTEVSELAARFSAHGKGSVSPELSADLALEVVLNEIVEQACLATGATGAAIVLWRDGELVCRANNGDTAPELGSRLDPSFGITGQCIRTYLSQRCNDVLADPQADVDASHRLGIRSVLVMPLLRRDNLLGIFELFSSRPSAFGERDERTLEALVTRTLTNLNRAWQPPVAQIEAVSIVSNFPAIRTAEDPPESADNVVKSIAKAEAGAPDGLTLLLSAAVLICAVLLGVLVGRHFGFQRAAGVVRPNSVAATGSAASNPAGTTAARSAEESAGSQRTDVEPAPVNSRQMAAHGAPAGGLQIFEDGKEVFHMPPGRPQSVKGARGNASAAPATDAPNAEAQPKATTVPPEAQSAIGSTTPKIEAARVNVPKVSDGVVEVPTDEAEASVLHRVEPEYPEAARRQQIQGDVALGIVVGADGAVENVEVLSGPEQLAQASANAARQWRFKPHLQNGQAVRMRTKVTLSFRLPG